MRGSFQWQSILEGEDNCEKKNAKFLLNKVSLDSTSSVDTMLRPKHIADKMYSKKNQVFTVGI